MESSAESRSQRSLSCRGVSFDTNGRWVWLPRSLSTSSKIHPSLPAEVTRSFSQASSHFCDLDDDGDHHHDSVTDVASDDIEKQRANASATTAEHAAQDRRRQPSRLSVILLDQGLFTVYKRLFAAALAANMVMLALAVVGHFPYAKSHAALFSMGNILALTLCRSEALLRIVFWLAVKLLGRSFVPLFVKTGATSFLQSLGGIHSSCGVSSVAWLVFALILTIADSRNTSLEIVAVASAILCLLSISCMAAFPLLRHLHHNAFERTHRFAGWAALALLWAFVILTIGYSPTTKSYDNLKLSNLVKQQEFWFAAAITFFTILPWVTVRRVPVSVTAPSGHASIIKFAGGVKAGLLGRISRSPLSEWHAFGIISNGEDSHMMLAGAVGDFTRGLVSEPPSHLWVRQVHFAGLPYLVNMYRRAVLVATGSGICVFLSFLLQPCAADVCLVWVTKGVEQNFGKEVKEMMSGQPKGKVVVHDTAVLGRPNVAEMTVEAAKNWEAEVVVVTSNPQGSRDVVNACKGAGIAAFGPIWDS